MNTMYIGRGSWCKMPQVNIHQSVYERGRNMMEYGDSWSSFIERLMDVFVESNAEMDDGR